MIAKIASGVLMANITIRHLDDNLKAQLRMVAAAHGHSMEEEVRLILQQVLSRKFSQKALGSKIHQRFTAFGGVELALPTRRSKPRSANFSK